jgi:hypothetical protein
MTGRKKQFCGTWATRTPRLNKTIGPSLSPVVTWMSAICNVFPLPNMLLLNCIGRHWLLNRDMLLSAPAIGNVTPLSLPCHFSGGVVLEAVGQR